MKIFAFVSIIFFASCNSECKIDSTFKKFYFKNLHQVKDLSIYEAGQQDSVFKAFGVLRKLTGHSSGLRMEFHMGYENVDRAKDLKIWQEWYEDNKCNFTMAKADSVLQKAELKK